MTQVTDLEGAALAEIASRGSATSYAIARVFASSPSEYWSGSAGAVYPMLRRLAARGLVTPSAATDGMRKRVDYQLTAQGRAAMETWLLDQRRAAGLGFDPLRTRLGYLHLVSPARRKSFLRDVRAVSAEIAAQPAFPGRPAMQRIHESWLRARSVWLAMLDFVVK